jgi:hypothetical protein
VQRSAAGNALLQCRYLTLGWTRYNIGEVFDIPRVSTSARPFGGPALNPWWGHSAIRGSSGARRRCYRPYDTLAE